MSSFVSESSNNDKKFADCFGDSEDEHDQDRSSRHLNIKIETSALSEKESDEKKSLFSY
jgi:hypothetical protein